MDVEPCIQFPASLQEFVLGVQESVDYHVECFREFVFRFEIFGVGHIVSYSSESLDETGVS